MRRAVLYLAVAALAWVSSAGVAGATLFTLDASVPFAGGSNGAVGSIDPVTDLSGVILLSNGVVNFGLQDVFVVDITLSAGTLDAMGMTVGSPLFFLNPAGAGAFDDTGAGDIAPTAVLADSGVTFSALFTFGAPLAAGQTSVRLFSTHSPQGDMAEGQTVSFMMSSGTDFTVQGILIPEPGTFALLAMGLAGLGVAGRRRS